MFIRRLFALCKLCFLELEFGEAVDDDAAFLVCRIVWLWVFPAWRTLAQVADNLFQLGDAAAESLCLSDIWIVP